jgi:endonuclease III
MEPVPYRSIPWARILARIAESVGARAPTARIKPAPEAAFRILVTTMISPRTKDEVTDAAADRLLASAPAPEALAALPQEQIARLIYPAGFYRVKAASLRAAATLLVARHGSRVPESVAGLLELPGVGRKIANLVASRAFGIDAICVDTHVHRISNRAGWVAAETPERTEQALAVVLPKRYWSAVNELLVSFGKRVCTPQSPRCSECPIAARCRKVGVTRSR